MKLESGQILSGTFRIVRQIAEGGMGAVWLAEDFNSGTRVAIKTMSPRWAPVPSAAARLVREGRMTAQASGPRVVRLVDCRADESGEPYLVFELLEGENLAERVRKRGLLPLAQAADVVEQVCEALCGAHDARIIHRDVKPDNVFVLTRDETSIKLLDFGVARPLDDGECLEADRTSAGTPRYMSPEQLFDPDSADARSDLFSLAAVVYFALTGHAPFESDTLEGLCLAIESGEFRRPSERRPDLPQSLDRWFEKALAREPVDRFADAASMARAFRAAIAPRPTRAHVLTGAQARPRHAALLGIACLGAFVLAWTSSPDAAQTEPVGLPGTPATQVPDAGEDAPVKSAAPVGDLTPSALRAAR